MPASWSEIESSPKYLSLDEDKQADVRKTYFEKVIEPSEKFRNLAKQEHKDEVQDKFLQPSGFNKALRYIARKTGVAAKGIRGMAVGLANATAGDPSLGGDFDPSTGDFKFKPQREGTPIDIGKSAQRATEATKVGFKPENTRESLASETSTLLDPRLIGLGAISTAGRIAKLGAIAEATIGGGVFLAGDSALSELERSGTVKPLDLLEEGVKGAAFGLTLGVGGKLIMSKLGPLIKLRKEVDAIRRMGEKGKVESKAKQLREAYQEFKDVVEKARIAEVRRETNARLGTGEKTGTLTPTQFEETQIFSAGEPGFPKENVGKLITGQVPDPLAPKPVPGRIFMPQGQAMSVKTAREIALEKTKTVPELIRPNVIGGKGEVKAGLVDEANQLLAKIPEEKTASLNAGGIPPIQSEDILQVSPTKFQVFTRRIIDRFNPIKHSPKSRVSNAPEHEKLGGTLSEAYVAARRVSSFIRAKGELLLEDVNSAVKPLKNYKDRQAFNVLYSNRNFAQLNDIGKTTSGVTRAQADRNIALLREEIGEEAFNRISKAADDIAHIQNDKGLNLLVESGIISDATRKDLIARYPSYLRSEIIDDQLGSSFSQLRGINAEPLSKINKSFMKTKNGTELQINDDVLDVVRRSLIAKVSASEKQKVIDLVTKDFGKQVGKTIEGKKIIDVLNVDGLTSRQKSLLLNNTVKDSSGKIYAVNPEVKLMLDGMNKEQADIMTRGMLHYNSFFRAGATTWRIPFVATNIMRDVPTYFFNQRVIRNQGPRVKAIAEGAMAAVAEMFGKKTSVMAEFKAAGGAYGGIASTIPKEIKIPYRLRTPTQKLKDAFVQPITLPFRAVGAMAEAGENMSRLAEFIRLKNTNLPLSLRALHTRDITVDFEKAGDAVRLVNRWIPFLNAEIQGNVNYFRAMKDQPLVSAARVGYLIVLPDVSLYAWNRQFKNDNLIDPYIKENYFYANSGHTVMQDGKEMPVIYTVRKSELAKTVSFGVNMVLEGMEGDPNFKERMKAFTASEVGYAALNRLTPPLIRAITTQASNFDPFRRQPVISQRLKDVEPGSQFTAGTPDTLRLLGEKTGFSPRKMETFSRDIFPATPQLLEGSDLILRTFGVSPKIPRKGAGKIKAIGNFLPIVKTPSGYHSPEESAAQEFEQRKNVEKRTPRFLYEEAYRMYLDERSPENFDRVVNMGKQLNGRSRKDIIKKVKDSFKTRSAPAGSRAVKSLPKNMRTEFKREMFRKEQQ